MRILLDWEPPDEWMVALWRRIQVAEGWLSILLLATIVLATVWSVEAAVWVSKLPSLGWIALAAMTFGIVFAKMHFRGLILHPIAFVYGVGVVLWQTMSVINLPTWEARFVDLVLRLNAWGYAARTGGINTDSLVFVFTLVCLTWLVGYLSAWFVFRSHHIWWGVVPSGAAILTNLRYAPPNVALWFTVYLFAAMLLIIRLNFFLKERDWKNSEIRYAPGTSFAYLPTAFWLSIGVLTAAWVIPSGAVSTFAADTFYNVSGPWRDFQGDFSRLFASLTSQVEDSYSSFGRTMILKGPISLSTKVTVLVNSEEPHYWRATTYDSYAGRGWVKSDRSEIPIRPSSSIAFGRQYQERKEITQTVTLLIPKNDMVLGAGQPVRLSLFAMAETVRVPLFTVDLADPSQDRSLPPDVRRYAERIRRAVARAKADGTLGNAPWPTSFITDLPSDLEVTRLVGKDSTVTGVELMRASPYPMDIESLRSPQQLKKGQEYTVVSSVSTASEKQLRDAGTNYPDWVTERYLPVPPNFPSRVAELADMVTRDANNPYDKAVAIQNYLRKIKYNQNIDAAPATSDPIDYFLFTSREGYCDYYASAMVMMLRTQRIPARIATGYLTGSFDKEKGVYVVRESNAHAWPEVFFPSYGWIEFEPTASVDPIVRLSGDETGGPAVPAALGGLGDEGMQEEPFVGEMLPGDIGSEPENGSAVAPWSASAGALLVIGLLAALAWLGWQRGLSVLALPSQVYEKMCRMAGFAGLGPEPSQTPYEYSDYLGRALPENASDISQIADVYTVTRFGRKRPVTNESRGIERAWHRVRSRLLRRIIARR